MTFRKHSSLLACGKLILTFKQQSSLRLTAGILFHTPCLSPLGSLASSTVNNHGQCTPGPRERQPSNPTYRLTGVQIQKKNSIRTRFVRVNFNKKFCFFFSFLCASVVSD